MYDESTQHRSPIFTDTATYPCWGILKSAAELATLSYYLLVISSKNTQTKIELVVKLH